MSIYNVTIQAFFLLVPSMQAGGRQPGVVPANAAGGGAADSGSC